jgi:hypothetical protein|tara:strand:+ start:245 stop:463 length:219 start_codon:yes stop_codon:yes gene_type:complete
LVLEEQDLQIQVHNTEIKVVLHLLKQLHQLVVALAVVAEDPQLQKALVALVVLVVAVVEEIISRVVQVIHLP